MEQHDFYEFGNFRMDVRRRLLWRENVPISLTPKAFDTLLVLVEHRDRVLEKDELMTAIWGDTIVEESGLARNISVLRKLLGESKDEHQFIVTVPGRGYQFVADVRAGNGEEVTELVLQESKVSVVVEEEEIADCGWRIAVSKATPVPVIETTTIVLQRSRVRIAIATALFVLIALAATYWWNARQSAIRHPQPAIKSLAILPFRSLTPKAGDEYLGVGLADVMITRLSNVNQLIVRPTSSVLPFGDKDALQAGKALNVDSVLEGSVQQVGDRVRLTVRLLKTSDGQSLWAYQCDEQCSDVFQLQDLVAAKVTQALALQLTGAEKQRMQHRYTDNAAAYQAYLKGRYHTLQFTPEGNKQAVAELQEALRLDPNYALAYAGLADAYTAASEWLLPPREALSQARTAAEKALALDDTLAEAHAALGHVFVHQFNPAAEREFQRALELSPNSVAAMFFYGEYFMSKDADKGIAVLRRVQQLDPLSPTAGSFIGVAYWMTRRYDAGLREVQQALTLDPNNPFSRVAFAQVYLAQGNALAAITEYEKVKPQMPTTQVLGELGMAYARAGRRVEALKLLSELQQRAPAQYVSPFYVALVHTGLGDKEQAFAALEKALADQSEFMGWLNLDARFDSLRDDPRFAELLRRVGLAQ